MAPTDPEIISEAMSVLGRRKSKKKAKAARINGQLGGRPKLTREEIRERKAAKREANKRPATKTKKLPWRPFWNSRRGPIRRLNQKPYHGKSDRRLVIKERRERKNESSLNETR